MSFKQKRWKVGVSEHSCVKFGFDLKALNHVVPSRNLFFQVLRLFLCFQLFNSHISNL